MFYRQILSCSHGPNEKSCLMCKFAQKKYQEYVTQLQRERRKREIDQVEQLSTQRRFYACERVLPHYHENWLWAIEEELLPTCMISFSPSAADALQACSRQLLKMPRHEQRTRYLEEIFQQSNPAFDYDRKLLRVGPTAIVLMQKHVRGMIGRRRAYAMHLELMEIYGSNYWDHPPKMKVVSKERPVSPSTLNRKVTNFHKKRDKRLQKWLDMQERETEKFKKEFRQQRRLVHMKEFHQAIKKAFMQLERVSDSTSLVPLEKEAVAHLWWPDASTTSLHVPSALKALLEGNSEEEWEWDGETWTNEVLHKFNTEIVKRSAAGSPEDVLAQVLCSPSCTQGLAAATGLSSDPTAWLYPLPTEMCPARLVMRRRFQFLDHAYKFRMFLYRGLLVGLSQFEHLLHYPDTMESRRDVLKAFMQFYVKISSKLSELGKEPISGLQKKGGNMNAPSNTSVASEESTNMFASLDQRVVDQQRLWNIDVNELPQFGSPGLAQAVSSRSQQLIMMAIDIYVDLSRHQINRQVEVEKQLRKRTHRPTGRAPKHRIFIEQILLYNPSNKANRPSGCLFDYEADDYLMTAGNTGEDMQVKYEPTPGAGRKLDTWTTPGPHQAVAVFTTRMPEGHFFEFRLRSTDVDQEAFASSIPPILVSSLRSIRQEEYQKQLQSKETLVDESKKSENLNFEEGRMAKTRIGDSRRSERGKISSK